MRHVRSWPFVWCALLAALAFSFALSCAIDDDDDNNDTGAVDDDDDDDTNDDDDATDDDDAADDDDDDDDAPFSCEALTDEERNLFRTVFCAGASYSNPLVGSPPFTRERLSSNYQGKILNKVWENLGACVDYEPEVWIYWYYDVGLMPADTTLTWSVDAFFHMLDEDTELFRGRMSDYLDAIFIDSGAPEGLRFIAGKVPKLLMIMEGVYANRDQLLIVMDEEIAERPYATMIDFDYFMEKLLAGKIYYDGEQIGFFDIIQIDLLHATEFGHQVIADLYIAEINSLWPNLKIPTWGTIEVLD